MSTPDDDGAGWQVPTPTFDAQAAQRTLGRLLRELSLVERGDAWLLGGQPVATLAVQGDALQVRLAKRPARTPEWELFTLRSAPDLRRLQDEIRRRLLHWRSDA